MDLRKLCLEFSDSITAAIHENKTDAWRRTVDIPLTKEEIDKICREFDMTCESVGENRTTFCYKWDKEEIEALKSTGCFD